MSLPAAVMDALERQFQLIHDTGRSDIFPPSSGAPVSIYSIW
jgi:hypothetical protein